MVFDGQGVVFYIGLLLLNLEVQSIICNPIFITKNLLQKSPPCVSLSYDVYKYDTVWGLAPRKSTRNEKNNQSCNVAYLFQPHTFNVNRKNSNDPLHLTITFTDKRPVYRHHTQIPINAISQLDTYLLKSSGF